jgi:hypothetical protein
MAAMGRTLEKVRRKWSRNSRLGNKLGAYKCCYMEKVRYGKLLAVGAAILVVAQFVVIWRLVKIDQVPRSVKTEPVDRELRAKNEKLQEENIRLRLELEKSFASVRAQPLSPPSAADSIGKAADERRRVLMEAKKLGAVTHIPAVGRPRKLNSKFIQLFELSPSEQKDLQQAVDTAMKTIDRLEAENAKVETNAYGAAVISVKSYAEKGGVVYDKLLNAFARTLGPERYEAFTALSADSMESNLGSFGTREKTVTIQWNPKVKSYELFEQYRSFQNSGSSNSQFQTFSEVEKSYPELAPLIPAALKDKSTPVSR